MCSLVGLRLGADDMAKVVAQLQDQNMQSKHTMDSGWPLEPMIIDRTFFPMVDDRSWQVHTPDNATVHQRTSCRADADQKGMRSSAHSWHLHNTHAHAWFLKGFIQPHSPMHATPVQSPCMYRKLPTRPMKPSSIQVPWPEASACQPCTHTHVGSKHWFPLSSRWHLGDIAICAPRFHWSFIQSLCVKHQQREWGCHHAATVDAQAGQTHGPRWNRKN